MLEQIIFDHVERKRPGRIKTQGLQVACEHLQRRDAPRLDRGDELAPRRERKIGPAPKTEALRISEVLHRRRARSEEHTSELQSLMRISYAVFCLKKKKRNNTSLKTNTDQQTVA